MKKILLLFGISLIVVQGLLAMGESDDYVPVEGMENWTYTVDVSDMADGKYNLLIRARDEAGNLSYLGPYDFFVDEDSDLPRVGISSPRNDMRIGDALNIVGVCTDDDAVDKVYIQIDEDLPFIAEGKEFWSYYLDVSALEDGPHTITVFGEDINGVQGPSKSVLFYLDKSNPINTVTSHTNGVLVSGKVSFEGLVTDPNGIDDMSLSTDGGETFGKLSYSTDRKENITTFKFDVDTKDLEDGPYVYWIRSVDTTGSVGVSPFLFFVDNMGPQLTILYPGEEDVQNGRFVVAGLVEDKIGVESFTFIHPNQREPQEIVLEEGNPYFIQDYDFSGERASSVVVEFTLVDKTGNITQEKLKVNLDYDADLPVTEITYPETGHVFDNGVLIQGTILDDDGPAFLEYSVDGGEMNRMDSGDNWSVRPSGLAPGTHRIQVQAVDRDGLVGLKKEVSFVVAADPPVLNLNSWTVEENTESWVPGTIVNPLLGGTITGTLYSNDPKLTSVTFTLQDETPARITLRNTDEPGRKEFSINIRKKLPAGRYNVILDATDSYGNTSLLGTAFYVPPVDEESGMVLNSRIPEAEGLYYVHPHVSDEGYYLVSGEMPLTAWVYGDAVTNAYLENDNGELRVRRSGSTVTVEPVREGLFRDRVLVVETRGGKTYRSGKLAITTDTAPPAFEKVLPEQGLWTGNFFELSGTITDSSGLRSLEYSLDGETYRTLAFTEEGQSAAFSQSISLDSLGDGPIPVIIKAVDVLGQTSLYPTVYFKDTVSPELTVITPLPDDVVYGLTTVITRVSDEFLLSGSGWSIDGIDYNSLQNEKFLFFDINLMDYETLPEAFLVQAVDLRGNVTEIPVPMTVDMEANKPIVEIQTPGEGEVFKSDFAISGMVFDEENIEKIFYRLDGEGEFENIGSGNSFSIDILLDEIADDKHFVEVYAVDSGEVVSDTMLVNFIVSKEEPKATIAFPDVTKTVTGTIELQGQASDANGIKAIYISLDNGYTYHLADGQEEWSYLLNTNVLRDGTYSILVKAVDNTDTEGLFVTLVNVDNTSPHVQLDTPLDGAILTQEFQINGTGSDNIELTSLKMRFLSIDDASQAVFEYDLPRIGVFSETVDISSVPSGKYILRAEGVDPAGNSHYASRTVFVDQEYNLAELELFYPLAGESLTYQMLVAGRFTGSNLESLMLYIDDEPISALEHDVNGYFRTDVFPENMTDGEHVVQVTGRLTDGTDVATEPRRVIYSQHGGWVSITSVDPGNFISGRPFLEGTAGYNVPPMDPAIADDKDAVKAYERTVSDMKPDTIEVSLDNGRTFEKAKGTWEWKFRLETQNMQQGEKRIIVRAIYPNGEEVYTRTLINLDKTIPDMTLISHFEGNSYNDQLPLMGLASDNNNLDTVGVLVREGSKNRYEVPSFIQGMYIDGHGLGATLFDVGFGLTFFDDNVKLQVQAGMASGTAQDSTGTDAEARFSGMVIGGKLLANIVHVPFSFFFGPDWEFLSASVALGTLFSYFTNTGDEVAWASDGQFVTAVVGQVEIPKVTFYNNKFIRYISLYYEQQVWLIPDSEQPDIVFRPSFGVRIGLF